MGEYEATVYLENVVAHNLETVIKSYDDKLFKKLQMKKFVEVKKYLSEFCLELLALSDGEQVFIARVYFTSIITEIIRIYNRRNLLCAEMLAYAFDIIARIEKWKNISEFLLALPWFVDRLKTDIISKHATFTENVHVEKAIQLINSNLKSNTLSVGWIAKQINISTTHLSNLFKLELDETISNYIAKRKLDEITFELKHTNKSLNEIRKEYGFMNHSNFIQHFKRHKGVTPLKYKQKIIK